MKLETIEITEEPGSVESSLTARLDGRDPPGWLRFVALAGAGTVLCFGLVGLALAIVGWYTPALAFSLGTVASVGLVLLARPALSSGRPASRHAQTVAAIGVAAILAITAWNCVHNSEHILIDRDGGSYANTGRWIARTGSLEVKPQTGPLSHTRGVSFSSLAVYDQPNGTLQFQFAHLLPVLLAEGYAVGGDGGLFHLPELLGGVALLSFFVLAWRVIRRPWFALAATLALAFLLPQVSFTRDSYSEIPSQILLFTALWLIVSRTVLPHCRVALAAGLFLGATQATRIDALVFMIGVPVAIAIAWLSAEPRDRGPMLRTVVALVVGLLPGMLVGLADLVYRSGDYYRSLWGNTRTLLALVVVSAALSGVLVACWRFVGPFLGRLNWNVIGWVVGGGIAVIGFGAWILRPRLQETHGDFQSIVASLQHDEHQRVIDGTRLYYEYSLTWMKWYLGPLTLTAAIVGAAILMRALLTGRERRLAGVLAVLVPGSLLYLLSASAVGDHVWVTRRFLVSAFPTLILLSVGLAAYGWGTRTTGRRRSVIRAASALVAIGAVAWPVYTVLSVASMEQEHGFVNVVDGLCDDIGPRAAVVVLHDDTGDFTDQWIPQALRSWCGADVGSMHGPADGTVLRQLASEYRALGRRFFVVAKSGDVITRVLPEAHVLPPESATDQNELVKTLTHRPDGYRTDSYSVAVAEVATEMAASNP